MKTDSIGSDSTGANSAESVDAEPAEKSVEETVNQEDAEITNIQDHEDNNHSNDGIDIDMADIIVIDEYDSTKKERKSKKKVIINWESMTVITEMNDRTSQANRH